MGYIDLESRLKKALALTHRPVAVSIVDSPPEGVPAFTGTVPSGCTFWQLASEGRSFYTANADHYNCAVGCHTHNIPLPPEREGELMATVGFMIDVGYIKSEEVPGIVRLEKTPKYVAYAPLSNARRTPDVVIVRGVPGKLMLLQEAAYRAGVKAESSLLARPTCMAIPAAMSGGVTATTGCVGNRVYTGLGDDELYVMIPGADVAKVVDQLQTILAANTTLGEYHAKRRSELLQV